MININKQTNNLRNKKNRESLAQYYIELKLLPVGLREIKKGCIQIKLIFPPAADTMKLQNAKALDG
jgi:hypothetical protein